MNLTELPIVNYQRRLGEVTYQNIEYLQQVNYQNVYDNGHNGGISTGCNVHFFNKKGVLLGRVYKFVPYELLSQFKKDKVSRERLFMDQKYEKQKTFLFGCFCKIITWLIKKSQNIKSNCERNIFS